MVLRSAGPRSWLTSVRWFGAPTGQDFRASGQIATHRTWAGAVCFVLARWFWRKLSQDTFLDPVPFLFAFLLQLCIHSYYECRFILDWRRSKNECSPLYAKVRNCSILNVVYTLTLAAQMMQWFADDPKQPFSLHRIAHAGLKYGKNVGEWFGPSTMAQVIE